MDKEKLIIIGGGIAGLSAAIYAARAELNPLVICGKLPGGQLTQTTLVENYPGFSNGIQGFELMSSIQEQAMTFGARIEYDEVMQAELTDGGKQIIHLSSGRIIEADALIIAVGAVPRFLNIESENKFKYRGISACAVCDGNFYRNMDVCVIGGGDSAMEEADSLSKIANRVYLIHRRDNFNASPIMVERVKKHQNIEIIFNSSVIEFLGDKELSGVKIQNSSDNSIREIQIQGAFVALGYIPATTIFANQLQLDERGFIVLKNRSSETNLRGVFAAGDCADPTYRQAIHAAGMGCAAALDALKYLNESK
ncbi:MAG: thioredoxin-disulfide reductase [Lentisphaeria bacterium]|nr:thioredoxin-disulfide reductase [Lentisphaeria bacterium]